jgi:CheY-like chemotaxis protein
LSGIAAPREHIIIPCPVDAAGDEHVRTKTVLVVKSNVIARTQLAESFRSTGYKTVEAVDASDAMWIFSVGVKVDLVIADQRMPSGASGYLLAAWIRVRQTDTRVIILAEAEEPPEHVLDHERVTALPEQSSAELVIETAGRILQ